MILAVQRLKAIGWIALIFSVLIGLYPLSLSVATLRSDLLRMESEIVRTKAAIRYLETEFATRGSLSQLEAWNDLGYGYVAPRADQYLEGERALANLGDNDGRMNKPVRVAAMTVTGNVVDAQAAAGSTLDDLHKIEKKSVEQSGDADQPKGENVRTAQLVTGKPSQIAIVAPIRNPALNDRLMDGLALEATVEQLRDKAQ